MKFKGSLILHSSPPISQFQLFLLPFHKLLFSQILASQILIVTLAMVTQHNL